MLLHSVGALQLIMLMRAERKAGREPDNDWLLFAPSDPGIVEPPTPPTLRLAGE